MTPESPPDMGIYRNPLADRYAGREMLHIFSPDFKFGTWRKLWLALAESQQSLGLPISDEQLDEMRGHLTDIDYEKVRQIEQQTRHDVMAHLHAFAELCPAAKPIMHLGATSAFVGDNTDLVQIREAGQLVVRKLASVIGQLRDFALSRRDLATLGFTHFQPAQLTTVGKRACLWLMDLVVDFEAVAEYVDRLPFRGVKGTTGTQASYLKLFDGDHEKVKALDRKVADSMGFGHLLPVTGQTYTRKLDARAGALLSGIAQSLHKLANDIRLLQHLGEVEEPFGKSQVGSSAMAYKRNPMRSERLTALARYVISLAQSPAMTAAEQWFERTLDDSANKRLSIPEAFLAIDASLNLAHDICGGLVVYPEVIARHVNDQLPFIATENILMEAVKRGGDRQRLHEAIRLHSQEAAMRMKREGAPNDLLKRIADDERFGLSTESLETLMDRGQFAGRAPRQVDEFVESTVNPLLERARAYGKGTVDEVTV